jgi:hypothetical protein
MRPVKFSLAAVAIAITAFGAHATGVNQAGNSNANSQTTQPHAPIDAVTTGPTYNNGVGVGITQGNINNTVSTAATGIGQGGSARQKQAQAQAQKQKQQQSQSATASNANAQSVTVQTGASDSRRIPVATAYAAGLTASNGTCLGSASGGIQIAPLGISGGSTKKDEGCDRRYNAQMLNSMGLTDAAIMLMCQDDAVRDAMTATGRSCAKGGEKAHAAVPVAPVAPVVPVLYTAPAGTPSPAATFIPVGRAPREDRGALGLGGAVHG